MHPSAREPQYAQEEKYEHLLVAAANMPGSISRHLGITCTPSLKPLIPTLEKLAPVTCQGAITPIQNVTSPGQQQAASEGRAGTMEHNKWLAAGCMLLRHALSA